MLALGRIDTLGYSVFSHDIHGYAFPRSFFLETSGFWYKIERNNYSIMSHFSTRECLESLSKDLKWAFLEVQGAVDRIWNHLSSKESPLSSKDLTSPLDTAFNYLNYLRGGYGLREIFRPSFANVGTNINYIFSVVIKIWKCVNNMKEEELTSSCEDIKKKISVIYKRIEGLQDRTGKSIERPAPSTLV
jgi:hypothetical protein